MLCVRESSLVTVLWVCAESFAICGLFVSWETAFCEAETGKKRLERKDWKEKVEMG